MANTNNDPYVPGSKAASEQAETSNYNPKAATPEMRILIELQVISSLLREGLGIQDDLSQMRADIAKSIT